MPFECVEYMSVFHTLEYIEWQEYIEKKIDNNKYQLVKFICYNIADLWFDGNFVESSLVQFHITETPVSLFFASPISDKKQHRRKRQKENNVS